MRFSVIVPVRDGAATIERAVTSCLVQDWADFEVVVVDNGSRDRTSDVVKGLRDPRVRLIQLEQAGRSRARNVGMDEASGDVVVFLDADDELHHSMLSRCADALSSVHVDAVQGATLFVREDGSRATTAPYGGDDFYARLVVRNAIPINSMAIRRSACSRFPEFVEHCEDWAFWLESLKGRRVEVQDDVYGVVYVRSASTSADVATMRAFELPVFIRFLHEPLPSRWAVRRRVRMLRAATDYAGIDAIPEIDAALRGSSLLHMTRIMRSYASVRRASDSTLRLLMRGAA